MEPDSIGPNSDFRKRAQLAPRPAVFTVEMKPLVESQLLVANNTREGEAHRYFDLMNQVAAEGIVNTRFQDSIVTAKRTYEEALRSAPFTWELFALDCFLTTKGHRIFHAELYLYQHSEGRLEPGSWTEFFVVVGGEIMVERLSLVSHEPQTAVDHLTELGIFAPALPFPDDHQEAYSGASARAVARMRRMYARFYDSTEAGRIAAMVLGNLRLDDESFWLSRASTPPLDKEREPSVQAMIGTLTTHTRWLLFLTFASLMLRLFWR